MPSLSIYLAAALALSAGGVLAVFDEGNGISGGTTGKSVDLGNGDPGDVTETGCFALFASAKKQDTQGLLKEYQWGNTRFLISPQAGHPPGPLAKGVFRRPNGPGGPLIDADAQHTATLVFAANDTMKGANTVFLSTQPGGNGTPVAPSELKPNGEVVVNGYVWAFCLTSDKVLLAALVGTAVGIYSQTCT